MSSNFVRTRPAGRSGCRGGVDEKPTLLVTQQVVHTMIMGAMS
jgi:hypothetical protein